MKVQSQDWKKTETGPDQDRSRPEIHKTDQDHNRGPVFGPLPFSKIKDQAKTGLSGLNQFFSLKIWYVSGPNIPISESKILLASIDFGSGVMSGTRVLFFKKGSK